VTLKRLRIVCVDRATIARDGLQTRCRAKPNPGRTVLRRTLAQVVGGSLPFKECHAPVACIASAARPTLSLAPLLRAGLSLGLTFSLSPL
jgi:hypothetical protein